MALKVETENKGGGSKVKSRKVDPKGRWWYTPDRKKIVPDGHKDAASLYASGHKPVMREEFEALKKGKGK